MNLHPGSTAAALQDDGTLEVGFCLFGNPAVVQTFDSATHHIRKCIEGDKLILELTLKPDPLARGLMAAQEAAWERLSQEKELLQTGRAMLLSQHLILKTAFDRLYESYQRLFHYTRQSAWRRMRDKIDDAPYPEEFLGVDLVVAK